MKHDMKSADTSALHRSGSGDACTAMFLSLSTRLTMDRRALDAAIEDIRSRGFEILFIEFRNSVWEPTDEQTVKAAHHAVAKAHELGMRVWVMLVPDCVNGCPTYFARNWPDQMQEVVSSYETRIIDGKACLPLLRERRYGRTYLCVDRVFRPLADGSVQNVTGHVAARFVAEPDFAAGIIESRRHYGCGLLVILADDLADGPLWVYARFDVAVTEFPRFFDYAQQGWKQLGEDLLERYGDWDIEGIGWDEFGASCTWMHPKSFGAMTQSYLQRFRNTYGYDLRDRYFALDHDVKGLDCAMVRYHHWKLLADMHHDVLKYWKQRTRKAYGKADLEMGIHQTLHETSCDDLYVGALDLFGAVEGQSGGFTDSVFMREDSMLYNITLARGLGDVADNGVAWNNSWDFAPTDAQIAYYTRVMAMSRVRWLAHLYGDSSSFGPGYPHHPTWDTMQDHVEQFKHANGILAGATPDAEIAMLYTWEACAAIDDYDYMHIHRSSDMQAVKKLLLSGYGVDIIGAPQLETARVAGREVVINGRSYTTLLLPWLNFTSPRVLAVITEFGAAGGRIVIWGPPIKQLNTGQDVRRQLAELIGTELIAAGRPATQERHGKALQFNGNTYRYDPDADEPEFFCQLPHYYPDPRVYRLEPAQAEPLVAFDGEICGVRNGTIVYIAAEPPLCGSLLVDVIEHLNCHAGVGLPSGCIGRTLTDRRTGVRYLCVAGRHDRPMQGAVTCGPHRVVLNGERFCIYRLDVQGVTRLYST